MKNTYNKLMVIVCLCMFYSIGNAQEMGALKGKVHDQNGMRTPFIEVQLENTNFITVTDQEGKYLLEDIPYGDYKVVFRQNGKFLEVKKTSVNQKEVSLNVQLVISIQEFQEVVVEANQKDPSKKLEDITRLPLQPYEQIQNVYVLDEQTIKELGATKISEVTQNVSGVYTFATYGGVRESMSIRGFRGVPVMKNGILISADKRGRGFGVDLEGAASIQVIKGADAINMGSSTSYGNAGGLINITTKTPNFVNHGYVAMRGGSFGLMKPSFDIETALGTKRRAAFRINGSYMNTRTYQNIKGIGGESFYINPSFAFRPDTKTEIILELDHYNTSNAFDPGTINFSKDNTENDLYKLPRDQFLGFNTDNTTQSLTTATARIKRDLTDNVYLRGAFYMSNYSTSGPSTSLLALDEDPLNEINVNKNTVFQRALQRHKEHDDKYYTFQVDLVGQKIKTGIFTHTFQAGIDFKHYDIESRKYNSIVIDTVDVTRSLSNQLPDNTPDFDDPKSITQTSNNSFGFSAQEVFDIADRVRLIAGVRLGTINSFTPTSNSTIRSTFVNPLAGIMVKVWKDIQVFGSYTNTTDPSTAQFIDVDGNPLGNETFNQFETGIRSTWFNNRLRGDVVFYQVDNRDMNVQANILDENGVPQAQDYYFKGGHIRYRGIELDVIGELTKNITVSAGFARMEAEYIKSTEFWIGSSPKNIPDWTIHARVNYQFTEGAVRGLSIGAGYYYIGERAYNDWTQFGVNYHGIEPGLEPWNLKAYYTINAQVGYDFGYLKTPVLRNFNARLIVNNITDQIGYSAYRNINVNRVNPFNFGLTISYGF